LERSSERGECMPDFDLSVCICSWNTREDLRACLASIQEVRGECALELIVVDNASEDQTAEMVEQNFPWVRLFKMDLNLGFGKGHNIAFSKAQGNLLMPLNSDTLVHPGALEEIVSFMRQNPDVGILGPQLLNPDGSLQYSCRRFPTPMAALFRNTPLGKLFPNTKFVRDYLMQSWKHDEVRDVDWVSGAAICIRRELYEKIGGFDEQFFMYMEDVDLCLRAHQAGFRVVYDPNAVITHAIGRSTDRMPVKMIRQFHKSMLLFYKKHYLPKVAAPLKPIWIAIVGALIYLRMITLTTKSRMDLRRQARRKR